MDATDDAAAARDGGRDGGRRAHVAQVDEGAVFADACITNGTVFADIEEVFDLYVDFARGDGAMVIRNADQKQTVVFINRRPEGRVANLVLLAALFMCEVVCG